MNPKRVCIACFRDQKITGLSSIFGQNYFFNLVPGHPVSASWRLSGGCWQRALCSLSWQSFSRGRRSGSLEDRIQIRSRGVGRSPTLPLVPFMNLSRRCRMWRSGLVLRAGRRRWAAGSRRSCYALGHQLQFSLPWEKTAFWLWKSFLREDRQGIKAEK